MSNEARAEADRRWGKAHEYGMSPQFQAGLMDGFMAGAEWALSPERLAERDAEKNELIGRLTEALRILAPHMDPLLPTQVLAARDAETRRKALEEAADVEFHRAERAEERGEGVCRTCLAPIWNEGGTVGYRERPGWSDRVAHSGDSLVCFKAVEYRHVPLAGREAAIYDTAYARALAVGGVRAEDTRSAVIEECIDHIRQNGFGNLTKDEALQMLAALRDGPGHA